MDTFKILKAMFDNIKSLENIAKYYIVKRKNKKRFQAKGPYKVDGLKDYIKNYKKNCNRLKIKPNIKRVKVHISFNKNKDLNYISEEFYKYYVNPILNKNRYSSTIYGNKAYIDLLPKLFPEIPDVFCHNYIKKINGLCYNKELVLMTRPCEFIKELKDDKILLKKVIDTGGSRGVQIFFKNNNNGDYHNTQGESLINDYIANDDNFLLQEVIVQHPILSKFNSTSVNTSKLITYRSVANEEIHCLHHYMRFGGEGGYFDNSGSGGGWVKIHKNGKFDNIMLARDFSSMRKITVPIEYPMYKETHCIAKKIARFFPYHRLLAFDFTVDSEGNVKLIEINQSLLPETTNYLYGSLFGEFTEEVMDLLKK